jgi:hypothetical protein
LFFFRFGTAVVLWELGLVDLGSTFMVAPPGKVIDLFFCFVFKNRQQLLIVQPSHGSKGNEPGTGLIRAPAGSLAGWIHPIQVKPHLIVRGRRHAWARDAPAADPRLVAFTGLAAPRLVAYKEYEQGVRLGQTQRRHHLQNRQHFAPAHTWPPTASPS